MVVVNGKNTPMGRYPNSGYLTYQSHNSGTSITCSSLSGSPNWTGAQVAIKKEKVVFRKLIRLQVNQEVLLIITNEGHHTLKDNWGFFIENDPRTLDIQNEWYYNPSTRKLEFILSLSHQM